MTGPHYPRAVAPVWRDCKANARALRNARASDKPTWRMCLRSTLHELRDSQKRDGS